MTIIPCVTSRKSRPAQGTAPTSTSRQLSTRRFIVIIVLSFEVRIPTSKCKTGTVLGLRRYNIEPDPRVQRHKICCHSRHESRCAHLQPGDRSSESSEDEDHHYYTGNYHTQGIQSNERQRDLPTVNHLHPKSPNGMIDRAHRHAAPPERGTFARATVCKSHEDGCGTKIKAVRFEEDGSMPEYAENHHSQCPIHRTSSAAEDRHRSNCNSRQHQSQSRESRTYRWVWGPPLPAMASRRENMYYAES
ncbi:hypothetical protein N7527_004203 [Penicillium freii]|nr:hypothetical protein N7527_004203 [Penicillium freii]